jgi:VanZ family protein
VLKRYSLFIAIIYSIALTILSLITISGIPDIGISFGDKIFHFLAYYILTLVWFYALFTKFNFKKNKAILYAAIFSMIFGIVIELLQGSITTSRHSDVYDAIANTLGVVIAVLVLFLNNKIQVKN